MKHGAFHNKDCRACRIMFNILYYPTMTISIIVAIAGVVVGVELHLYRGTIFFLLLPLIAHIANKIACHIVPQSHGLLMDTCRDTSWYKPLNTK